MKWDFVYEQEVFDHAGWNIVGLLSDGEHFLFFHAYKEDESDPIEICHIYNSMLMTEDSEECRYPWTSENDERLLACLEECGNNYCGDDSPIQFIEFDYSEWEHQVLWSQISCRLNGTSEKEPRLIEDYLILPSIEEESCGLSDLEKLNIDKMYQMEGDGTMWYHFEDTPDTDEYWHDMYELSNEDLKSILEELCREGITNKSTKQ